ncbi:MBL fold metallo-hydrolase [Pedobacter sp. AW31-3R]|uniref:MBL fold metallo-hydrolase n=1 Tax=Pedobacter sp. AW31-3R TaxID=3445781 RepID=UPI003F9FDA9A
MKLQLLRNATQVLRVNDKVILIDPMLANKGTYEPFSFTGNAVRNPTADFPLNPAALEKLIDRIDAVILTHLHLDHWDLIAQEMIRKDIPIICQPWDVPQIEKNGFSNFFPVDKKLNWQGIEIFRTDGRHGTGEIGDRMGLVSGFVITENDKKLYLAGDTIWCEQVQESIATYQPDYIVVNGGGAGFVTGDPIVMDMADVIEVCRYAPKSRVFVVHLESVNHSKESRQTIKIQLSAEGLSDYCYVPEDGEVFLHT